MYEITLFGKANILFKTCFDLITQTYQNIGLYFNNYNPMSNDMIPLPTIRNVCIKETGQQIVDYFWIYKWITLLRIMGLSTN